MVVPEYYVECVVSHRPSRLSGSKNTISACSLGCMNCDDPTQSKFRALYSSLGLELFDYAIVMRAEGRIRQKCILPAPEHSQHAKDLTEQHWPLL